MPASHGDMPMDRVFTIAAVPTSVGLNTGLRLVHMQGGRLLERLRSVLDIGGRQGRVGKFRDIDLETVTSYHTGVPQISTATHRNLKRMLVEAGLEGAEADADVAALHHGRVLVLVRVSDLTPEAAAQALGGAVPV